MDSVNSTTFIKRPPCMTDIQEKYLYTKEALAGRIFLGLYEERRYVSALNEYRDIVVIHAEETELLNDLDRIRKKWLGVQNIKWVGITGPDAVNFSKGYRFWVKLTNLAFGQYWFQIKYVQLKDEEILLHLKCIRKAQMFQCAATTHREKQTSENKNEKSEPSTSINNIDLDSARRAVSAATKICDEAVHALMPHLTRRNFLQAVKVSWALTMAFVLGVISFVGHLGEFTLKLIRELSLLVNAVSPIIIQLIDFCSKLIGGFFILLAGLFGRNTVRYNALSTGSSILYNNSHPPAVDWRRRNEMLKRDLLSNRYRM